MELAPPLSRLPLPWSTTAAIANWMVLHGALEMAVLTVLTFVLYLRPSEALRLRHGDLVAPSRRGAQNLRKWSVVLHPQEGGTASKTGQFNESLLLDNVEFEWMGGVLRGLHRPGARDLEVFANVTYSEWARSFRQAGHDLGLQALGPPVLYQLRHGGASHEMLTGARGAKDIKLRGRWLSDNSLRRYEKGGRVAQQLALLPQRVQDHGHACADRIGRILSRTSPPLQVL